MRPMLIAAMVGALGWNGLAIELRRPIQGDHLSRLPANLKLQEKSPQKYKVYCDYINLDTLGNTINKDRVAGEYTRALPDGKVRWTNVRIAHAKGFDDPFPEGEPQKYMEGLSYSTANRDNLFTERFFRDFPPTEPKTKNLIWDMLMIEQFSWDYWDKLQLNQPYSIQSSPEDVPLAGSGSFQNRSIQLTWIGISKRNGELCALIQYHAFDNKFSASMGTMKFQGRSHYWGEIWVSLEDKQIEYATLFEDVLVQFALPGQSTNQLTNILRKGAFEKEVSSSRG
jgi:hypothetical protein